MRICGKSQQYPENIFTEEVFSPVKTELDPLFDIVRKWVIETQTISISAIQRKFNLSFSRAAHIMDQLETEGIVSELSKIGKTAVTHNRKLKNRQGTAYFCSVSKSSR